MINNHSLESEKTKPIKANIEWNKPYLTFNTEDCHGPLGLAMTQNEFEKTNPI